jgi:hypothetical protein
MQTQVIRNQTYRKKNSTLEKNYCELWTKYKHDKNGMLPIVWYRTAGWRNIHAYKVLDKLTLYIVSLD